MRAFLSKAFTGDSPPPNLVIEGEVYDNGSQVGTGVVTYYTDMTAEITLDSIEIEVEA